MNFKNTSTLLILAFLFQIPFMTFAQQQSPVELAQRYLEQNREDLKLTAEDIRHFTVNDVYMTRHNGLTHVYLNQTHENIKVRNAIININILPDGKILNIGNRFVSNLNERVNSNNPSVNPMSALKAVINKFEIATNKPLRLEEEINPHHFVFDHDELALEPISVKLVYQTMEDKTVKLAWMVQLYQLDAEHWWNARVDAQTGEVLAHNDQVIHCNFDKHDNACTDHTHAHHHATAPTQANHNNTFSQVATVNSYNVFPMPVQSPNHGDRELVVAPADATASPFGWHDTDGVTGAEYTITRGNNVHAYHDIFSINASSGDEPDGTTTLDFDYPLDLAPGFPYTQVDPAVTNLFYWNNIIHDMWYQYGFDEASGNFQVDNYGNGGIGGDHVRAEALDGGGTNNANFGTAEDGSGARMQMYIWTNDPLPPGGGSPPLVVTEPMDLAGEYEMVQGGFGGAIPSPAIIEEVVLVDDTIGIGSDACEDITNGADLSGKIAMIDRGDCQFGVKCLKAENEGAIAVIVCNNVAGGPIVMGPGTDGGLVNIPVAMISLEDCIELKTGLPGLTVEFGGDTGGVPMPGPNGLDGDFDNGIIVHEYGHGISIRLTGGPSTGGCLGTPEQAGEGWSDWFALVMSTDASNNADENRGMGTYAIGEPIDGVGIREYPYSRDMNVNPHTYGDQPNVAVPHGVGSIWCAMTWDLYWNLVDEYGFDDDQVFGTGGNNIAMQLVIDGLKLQSCNPSFIDSRDGILAADEANYGGANKCLIWETFARRGLGWSASAGGNEAFDTPPFCTPLTITKTAEGEVIAGEVLTYTVEIANNVESIITDVVITDNFPQGTSYVEGSFSCPNGSVSGNTLTIDVGDLAQSSVITCTYQLLVDQNPFSSIQLADDVEAGTDNWAVTSPLGAVMWETNSNSYEGDFAWFAADIDSECDQYLTLAETINLGGTNPALAFWHWYNTEASWDGGVVEISVNGGATWFDLGSNMIKNGYNSTLEVNPASPISGQPAFNGNSGGYIQTLVDLTNFSGDDIMIRFRFGCDGLVGADGWYIDNIEFYDDLYSITNTACVTATDNQESCDDATTLVFGDGSTAVGDLDNDLKVSISPNPTDGVFILKMQHPLESESTIQVMSMDGKLLQSHNFNRSNGSFEFDLSDLSSGIYLLQIQTEGAQRIEKIVIQ